jgi:hypothetical protein
MATTTNYGWTTPDDTALVKDGASAIRTLGSSVDTTTKALNPSTTLGDIEYRSSTANTNTRVGIGSTGQALTVVGGVPAWAASPTSVLTTKGDLLTEDASNVLTRLGVGANNTVLTADSAEATGLKWAAPASGGMTLLSTTTLSGATTTISSISQSYNELYVLVYGMTNATANGEFWCNVNSVTSGVYSANVRNSTAGATTNGRISLGGGLDYLRTDANNVSFFRIQNYASTANYKSYQGSAVFNNNGTVFGTIFGGGVATNSAITSLQFQAQGGNLSTGTVLIYGVK